MGKNNIKNCLNGNVEIGEGSLIMPGVVINTETKIGKHCIINTSSSIDHHNYFKDYSSCGPGVITGGKVTIGENSLRNWRCSKKWNNDRKQHNHWWKFLCK